MVVDAFDLVSLFRHTSRCIVYSERHSRPCRIMFRGVFVRRRLRFVMSGATVAISAEGEEIRRTPFRSSTSWRCPIFDLIARSAARDEVFKATVSELKAPEPTGSRLVPLRHCCVSSERLNCAISCCLHLVWTREVRSRSGVCVGVGAHGPSGGPKTEPWGAPHFSNVLTAPPRYRCSSNVITDAHIEFTSAIISAGKCIPGLMLHHSLSTLCKGKN